MAGGDDTEAPAADKGGRPGTEYFELDPELLERLRQAAEQKGVSVEELATEALHKAAAAVLDDERAERKRNAPTLSHLFREGEAWRLGILEARDRLYQATRRRAWQLSWWVDPRAAVFDESDLPLAEARGTWCIMVAALRHAEQHEIIHGKVAKLIADAIEAALEGRLPAAWRPPRGAPRGDRARPEWKAQMRRYVTAASLELIDDKNYVKTVREEFDIDERTYAKWMSEGGGIKAERAAMEVILDVHAATHAQMKSVLPSDEPDLPPGLIPEVIEGGMRKAAAAYRARRKAKRTE